MEALITISGFILFGFVATVFVIFIFMLLAGIKKPEIAPKEFKFQHVELIRQGNAIHVFDHEGSQLITITPHYNTGVKRNITNEQSKEITYAIEHYAELWKML